MIKQIINKLNDQLALLRPDYFKMLKTPLSDAEIQMLEQKYELQLPSNLKDLYKWKNGQNMNCYEAFVNNSSFLPLEDVLESWKELNSMIDDFENKNWWSKKWLPIFHNGGGCYICYDLEGMFTGDKGQLIEYWNDDNDRNVIVQNLESFISQLVGYYSNVQPENFDEYFLIENVERYPKSFIAE